MPANVDVESVVVVLHSAAEPLTASQIAQRLKSTRSEVNAVLYSGIGVQFRKTADERPRWSLLGATLNTIRPDGFTLRSTASSPVHIDLQGGDWTVQIVQERRSRNDPLYRVEVTGVRHARVLVNVTLTGADSDLEGASPSSAVLVAAAIGLTNQILLQRLGEDFERQRVDLLLRDVLHAFGS